MCDPQELLICPLCQEPLTQGLPTGFLRCANNHHFDIARQGYINLLPSNRKKSRLPGDSKDMVASRRLFLNGEHYSRIADRLSRLLSEDLLSISGKEHGEGCDSRLQGQIPYTVLDLGCGEGYYTRRVMGELARQNPYTPLHFYGIDISKAAVKQASAMTKKACWIVGTNYHLPIKSDSLNGIFSVFSPVMLSECCRTLKSQGLFIRVLPGASHLIEIRDIIYPKTLLNTEAEKEEACVGLTHMTTEKIEFNMGLNQESLLDLVRMTPHYWKTTQADKNALKEFSALQVTASLLVFVYKKSS